ncbi:3-hydroxybutyryl-CoA dehydrogenase [Enterococcus sp. AZ150]|uniref:3-hydroxybutyryl-CoA dehydrogenase n=1 Tax=Enterococcus sulfureus ATCC 49903 TaxID=1140003 RepID=S0L0N5_9ENTE|nr:3-hydroxyacyl-CoA dehydrogenase [Enterococcus sulfureus]EOT45893.1 hypothetical protein OMY_01914 [Enterococcus sulfureus ATCC 49903]EOT83056.1 hypothetical protein I573_02169 [Enterococcus sulfureus ATCC 49903]
MTIKTVVVAGAGVLGSQIAFQNAYHGKQVWVYDIKDEFLDRAKGNMEHYQTIYSNYFQTPEQAKDALTRLHYTTDLKQAVADADLVIEAVPEVLTIKQNLFKQLGELAPENTILATNTSTMLPSQFAEISGRPEKVLALHFANEIWLYNTAEIMGQAKTSPELIDEVVAFAREIGLIPIRLNKEQPGYVLNTMIMPLLDSAMYLWVNGISDPQTIDKDWMISTKMGMGPFGMLDMIGMRTQYDVLLHRIEMGETQLQPLADRVKKEFIDQNKLGISTGEGFYHYPSPAFMNPNFLR